MKLINGDCLEEMKKIPDGSIDLILTDPPYGTTACKWDNVIPFDEMWKELNRIIKPNGAILLFGSEPFSSALRMSNIKNYKYDWIWSKDKPNNFATAKYIPMKYHETISVFYKKAPLYIPQMIERTGSGKKRYKTSVKLKQGVSGGSHLKSNKTIEKMYNPNLKFPSSILNFSTGRRQDLVHPTQKPVALLEYLIKTYTIENETVLDFTMGSGSTGVAAKNLNRDFIGIELDKDYFKIAKKRIEEA
jgi:site-specific DNA-methyltransferase (adenine-specific)